MKVIVTQADLEKMVRAELPNLGAHVELTVVYDSPTPVTVGNYVEALHRVMYEFPRHLTDQKIQAIKRLRELVPGIGLADSKYAIENVNEAIKCFIRTGNYYR